MRTTLEPMRLHVHPGVPVNLDVEVTNTSAVIDGISAIVVGLDPRWVQLLLPVLSLFPDSSGKLTLRFDVPLDCPAGDLPLVVRLFSTIDPDLVEERDITLVVEPVAMAEMRLKPSLVNGGASAELHAVVKNTGNVPVELSIDAVEPNRVVHCTVSPTTLLVPPGEEADALVTAAGKRPWFGNPVPRTINVTGTASTFDLAAVGRFNQRPRIPRGAVTALLLAGIILLWALIFLWVIKVLGQDDTNRKVVPTGFLDGATEFQMDNIGGKVTGRVTAASSGDALERITVEAFRINRNGVQGDAAEASAATTADGTFVLEALVPGTYRFRFSAPGYTPMWCETTATAVEPTNIDVMPSGGGRIDPVCNEAMVGLPGSLTIAVEVPPGTTGDATVTVQQVVPAGAPAATAQQATKNPDGTYSIGGLVTPALYSVTIQFPGFDAQTFRVSLAGGAQPVLDPSALTASPGTISGTVVGANGGLGGVTVTLRSGAIERTLVTPTVAGTVGQFVFEGLTTPGTYVLTYSLDGYSSVTQSFELAAGGSREGQRISLVAGGGSVTGTVTATGTGPLGGVVVTVSGGGFSANTATLTGGATTGSFTLSGIPTPGDYTVSFAAPGYRTEYLRVSFAQPGQQSLAVQMTAAVAQVKGTVLVDGTGTGALHVELSDGSTVLATVTTNSPAGAFSFSDVPPGVYTLTVWRVYTVNTVVQQPSSVSILRLTAGGLVTPTISILSP